MPVVVREAMKNQRDVEIGMLVSSYGYTRADQLPEVYVHGLRTAPWHDSRDFQGFQAVETELREMWSHLRDESLALVSKNLTEPDFECIHAPARGSWQRFSVNSPWQTVYVNHRWFCCAAHG
jgi:hypothetical protein